MYKHILIGDYVRYRGPTLTLHVDRVVSVTKRHIVTTTRRFSRATGIEVGTVIVGYCFLEGKATRREAERFERLSRESALRERWETVKDSNLSLRKIGAMLEAIGENYELP